MIYDDSISAMASDASHADSHHPHLKDEATEFMKRVIMQTPHASPMEDSVMCEADEQSDQDVVLGSFFLSHLKPICENCATTKTSQWRKGWYSQLLGRSIFLCNACGLRYHKNQFCPYCNFVYSKDEKFDQHNWFTCRVCKRCTHIKCEQAHSRGKLDDNHHVATSAASYVCPDCVHELPQQPLPYTRSHM